MMLIAMFKIRSISQHHNQVKIGLVLCSISPADLLNFGNSAYLQGNHLGWNLALNTGTGIKYTKYQSM